MSRPALSRNSTRVLPAVVAWLSALPLVAQTVTGTISGSVTDSSAAVVPAAKIVATNTGTNFSRTTATDSLGNYLLTFLPPGIYDIAASSPGFKPTIRSGVIVGADERLRVDFTLSVGDATQTVEVVANASLLHMSDATVGEVVDTRRIAELPLNGRNFVDLVELTAGVTPGRAGEFGGVSTIDNFRGRFTFNANGQRSTTSNFILDGIDNNANLLNAGGIVIEPVVDAIEEFKVSTGNFSPEFGRATGGVVSVQTKAGTNQLHGTAFEFLRNSDFDANTFFNNRGGQARPPFRQNQFGFTAGGPIRKDKTFFFGDYQGLRVRDTTTFLSSVPTVAARQGDFSAPVYKRIYDPATAVRSGPDLLLQLFPDNRIPSNRFDPVFLQAVNFFQLPNTNGTGLANNFLNNPARKRTDDQFDIRIDHRFENSSNFFVRYSLGDAEQLLPNNLLSRENPFGGGGKGNLSTMRAQSVAVNYIRTLTPKWFLETRVGFTRTNYFGYPLGNGDPAFDKIRIPNQRYNDQIKAIPTFSVTGFTPIGPQGNVPNHSVQNVYQLSQNLVYSVGARHSLKFGGDLMRRQLNNNFTGAPTGSFGFSGSYTNVNARTAATGGEPMADFLLGLYSSASRDILTGGFGRRSIVGSWYFQDDIKVTRRLSINAGVRWDLWTPLYEENDRQANFDLARGKFILAGDQQPLGRGLRATDWNNFAPRFGFAYDLFGNGRTVFRAGYSISYLEDLTGGSTMLPLNPPFAFSDQIVNPQGIIPTQTLQNGFGLPVIPPIDSRLSGLVHQTDTNYRTGYSQSWSAGIQRELSRNLVADITYAANKGTKLFQRIDGNQPTPGPGDVASRRLFFSSYPALGTIDGLLSAANSTYHALQLKLTKRYSSGLSFLAAYTYGRAIEGSEGVGETNVGASVQTKAQDPNNRRAEKALAGFDMRQRFSFSYGYELPFGHGKPYLSSGFAGQIVGGWRLQGITTAFSGNPFSLQMASSGLNTGTFQRPNRLCDGKLSGVSIDRFFDTSCFVAPPAFGYGNAGRDILIGPGAVNFDTSIARNIRIRESKSLEFRAEAFNLFNTPQFYPPNNSIGNRDASTIAGVRGGSNRQIQLALKLIF